MSGQLALSEFHQPEQQMVRWTDWHVFKNLKRSHGQEQHMCQNCDEQITARFAKVFGDNDDIVHACRNCASYGSIVEGAAADPTVPIIPQGGLY